MCGRGKVSLCSNRTGLARGEKGLQVDSDGGSKQNCHGSRSVFLVSLGPWGALQGGRGRRTKGIDRSVQSGLKSSASHGVHGQAGVSDEVFEAAKRLAALGPHRLECDG